MRFFKTFLSLSSLLFVSANLFADFNVEAQWLYFRPSIDSYFFITDNFNAAAGSTSLESSAVDPSHHSGWRVGLRDCFCDLIDVSVRYSQLRTQDSDTFSTLNGYVFPDITITSPGDLLQDKLFFNYYAFDIALNHGIYCNRLAINLFGGVHYTWLGIEDKATIISGPFTGTFTKQTSHFSGIGPELGIDLSYPLWCGFSLTGRGAGSLLASKTHHNLKTFLSQPNFFFHQTFDSKRRVIFAWDLQFGLRYAYLWECWCFYAEAGYEALSYNNSLQLLDVASLTGNALLSIQYSNATMQGIYVSAGIAF